MLDGPPCTIDWICNEKYSEKWASRIIWNIFSDQMKEYIIDACKKNGFDLQLDNLNTFFGIMMISSCN